MEYPENMVSNTHLLGKNTEILTMDPNNKTQIIFKEVFQKETDVVSPSNNIMCLVFLYITESPSDKKFPSGPYSVDHEELEG